MTQTTTVRPTAAPWTTALGVFMRTPASGLRSANAMPDTSSRVQPLSDIRRSVRPGASRHTRSSSRGLPNTQFSCGAPSLARHRVPGS